MASRSPSKRNAPSTSSSDSSGSSSESRSTSSPTKRLRFESVSSPTDSCTPCSPKKVMDPARPSEYERTHYYDGVQGHLLARTSSYEFPDFTGLNATEDFEVPDNSKVFNIIGKHPLVSIWSNKLVGSIQDALNNVEWEAFYPIRIGVSPKRSSSPYASMFAEIPRRELVLMVDVVPGTTDWEGAIPAALACRSLLRNEGIQDIEVEMREIHREPFGGNLPDFENAIESKFWENQAPSPQYGVINKDLIPILPLLGHTIQPSHATSAGTMGLYIKLDGRPSEVFGLTCRHVVVPSNNAWLSDQDSYNGDLDKQQRLVNRGYRGKFRDIQDSLDSFEKTLDPFLEVVERRKMKHDMDPDSRPWTSADQRRLESLQMNKDYLGKIRPFLDESSDRFVGIPAIGHVAFLPPFEVTKQGFLRDWALIRLDLSKYPNPIINKVYVGGEAVLSPDIMDAGQTFATLRAHKSRSFDHHPRTSFIVGKCGQKTQLTYGMTNDIKAIVRQPSNTKGNDRKITWEWLVISMDLKAPFSQPGDSGSCVFDTDGQVIGMVVGGAKQGENGIGNNFVAGKAVLRKFKKMSPDDTTLPKDTGAQDDPKMETPLPPGFHEYKRGVDVSFITPIQYIFDDIERETGCRPDLV
ncbi:hypothetical protein B0T24DRAFT_638142 [Lasiosphaeria ovina]|uniref:Uncharacterized protein n=1 Tax=Lasiosphaeria ovina TaxID=92902 RepID=A0AAE0N0W5_9PEZI|nr:hypothetical protein B0T24DRAFT_638142 [Lasiosphaeria ovina]